MDSLKSSSVLDSVYRGHLGITVKDGHRPLPERKEGGEQMTPFIKWVLIIGVPLIAILAVVNIVK